MRHGRVLLSVLLAAIGLVAFGWCLSGPVEAQGGDVCSPVIPYGFPGAIQLSGDNPTATNNSVSVNAQGYLVIDLQVDGWRDHAWYGATIYLGIWDPIASISLTTGMTYTQWVIFEGPQTYYESISWTNFFGFDVVPTAGAVYSRTFVAWQWNPNWLVFRATISTADYDYHDTVSADLRVKTIILPTGCALPNPPTIPCNGIELISTTVYITPVVTMDDWTATITTTWSYLQATFVWSNTVPANDFFHGHVQLNDNRVQLARWGGSGDWTVLSVTVPVSDEYQARGPGAWLAFNSQEPVALVSVCLQEGQAALPTPDLRCTLRNYNFEQELSAWQTLWDTISYAPEQGDQGSAYLLETDLTTPQIQQAVDGHNNAYRLFVRARAISETNQLLAGAVIDTGSANFEIPFTFYATDRWRTYRSESWFTVTNNTMIFVQGSNNYIDFVCLQEFDPDDYLPIVECTAPSLDDHPEVSILEVPLWFIWLGLKFWEIIVWLGCLIKQVVYSAINMILDVLYTKIISPPGTTAPWENLPGFVRDLVTLVLHWLGISGNNFATGLVDLVKEVITWIVQELDGDPTWLLDTIDYLVEHVTYFREAILTELQAEFSDLLYLLGATGGAFQEIISGVVGAIGGTEVADLGFRQSGYSGLLWRGMQFVNSSLQNTPMLALNFIGLAIIALGLLQWTIKRLVGILERLSQ